MNVELRKSGREKLGHKRHKMHRSGETEQRLGNLKASLYSIPEFLSSTFVSRLSSP